MDFGVTRRRTRGDSIVPMINIVFLLLIFFLLTATVSTPPPFAVTPPDSSGGARAEVERTLFLAADGRIAYGETLGEAAFEAIADDWIADQAAAGGGRAVPLVVRADRSLPGATVATVLARLGALGVPRVQLVVGSR